MHVRRFSGAAYCQAKGTFLEVSQTHLLPCRTNLVNTRFRYECRFEGIDRLKQSMESARILSICQHCRLAKCRDVGMRDDYVHNLRFHRIERNSNKLTKNPTVTSFRSALDPGQLNLLELCVNFWR